MKKPIILIILTIIIIISIWWSTFKQKVLVVNDTYKKVESEIVVSTTSAVTSSSHTYRNEKYGFELTFPETWGKIIAKNDGFNIWFSSPNSEDESSIFYLSVMSEKEWKDCEESAKTGIPNCAINPVSRNSTTIVNYNSAHQDPLPLQEKRLNEVSEIIASFRFIK